MYIFPDIVKKVKLKTCFISPERIKSKESQPHKYAVLLDRYKGARVSGFAAITTVLPPCDKPNDHNYVTIIELQFGRAKVYNTPPKGSSILSLTFSRVAAALGSRLNTLDASDSFPATYHASHMITHHPSSSDLPIPSPPNSIIAWHRMHLVLPRHERCAHGDSDC